MRSPDEAIANNTANYNPYPDDLYAPRTLDEMRTDAISQRALTARWQLSALIELYGLGGKEEARAIAEEVLERLTRNE